MNTLMIAYLATGLLAILTGTATLTLLTTIALAVLPREPPSAPRCDLSELFERKLS